MAILDRAAAAKRVGRTQSTLYRWEQKGLLTFVGGRVTEAALLKAEKTARQRVGRPRAMKEVRV